jgi:transcription antitermination factor NusG
MSQQFSESGQFFQGVHVTEGAVARQVERQAGPDGPGPLQSDSLPWFALRVKSNFEKTASQILQQKGYQEFLPIYRTRSRWSDRIKTVERPLFPGYLFCRFDQQARLPILVTPGVMNVVGLGKIPVPIPEEEIKAVRILIDSGVPATPWPFVNVGQRLLIERGPLSGVEGILQEIRNRYRFIVSVNLLQRSVAAEVEADWVRPLDRAAYTAFTQPGPDPIKR